MTTIPVLRLTENFLRELFFGLNWEFGRKDLSLKFFKINFQDCIGFTVVFKTESIL